LYKICAENALDIILKTENDKEKYENKFLLSL